MATEKTTIWVVNEAGHEYEKALKVVENAQLRPLTIGSVNPLYLDRLNYNLALGIAKYAQAGDYLLISGTPAVNAMAVTLWLLRFGEVHLLQWNAKHDRYEKSKISEEGVRNLLERVMNRG